MYCPDAFRAADPDTALAILAQNPFALVISCGPEGPEATSLPLLARPGEGPLGLVLEGHFARPNAHWRAIGEGTDVLVVFSGAQHYVTPSWYPSKAETGKVVPTWNYESVHVRGRARAVTDAAWLAAHVRALTDHMERHRPAPWAVDDAPREYEAVMLRGIVGIEIVAGRIDAKVKASQNRTEADRRGVLEGLEGEALPDAARLALHIRRSLAGPGGS